jgi:murein L,D-transpeptidase YafK
MVKNNLAVGLMVQKGACLLVLAIFWLAACVRAPVPEELEIQLPATVQVSPEIWILVDTKADVLKVMRGNEPVEKFYNIALGSSGAGIKHREGDGITPLGVFRIGWINPRSRFKLFMGLDYPNSDYAERAYQEGHINHATYEQIRRALEAGGTPPQNTALGGQIGIHGIGAGDPLVHMNFNWTGGCVALNNEQIQQLAAWVQVGTRVEIR